ncbi:hypothetical protein ATSB10_30210 [Dyella thiooxydans]|uniref:Uncharacterized protein n=1 Tax=Dyella thiooxydans TaxID=445710 RepID=A0A169GWS2_9GAMM|nr:hypothetical protein ATSB10_30210 [Dyella thiooxydans]
MKIFKEWNVLVAMASETFRQSPDTKRPKRAGIPYANQRNARTLCNHLIGGMEVKVTHAGEE